MRKAFNSVMAIAGIITMSVPAAPVQAQSSRYEVLIIARKPENSAIPLKNDAGHAWVTIIREERDGWKTDATYGFWPGSNLSVNNPTDVDYTNKYLRGESLSRRGFAVRKAKISPNRANWIKNGAYREAGCARYQAVGGTGTSCNCADYATRLWHVLSAKQDDFRIRAVTVNLTLDSLVNAINDKNRRSGDFLDGGKTWQ
jgi:hypothetical protein